MTCVGIAAFVDAHAVEMDGRVIGWGTGRRLWDLSVGELLSWAYSLMVENLDAKMRARLDRELSPRQIVDHPLFPKSMQGVRAPSWFDLDTPTTGVIQGDFEVPTAKGIPKR